MVSVGITTRSPAAIAATASPRSATGSETFRDPAQARSSISTIAYELGFGSLGPFNRAFKDATGVTPTAWRASPISESLAET